VNGFPIAECKLSDMKKIILIITSLLAIHLVSAQTVVRGRVVEIYDGIRFPMPGVNIVVEGASEGTITNKDGYFELEINVQKSKSLEFSHVGFQNKKVAVDKIRNDFELVLEPLVMDDVDIEAKKLDRSLIDPMNVQVLTSKDLKKAACCNLSESFDTNVGVDVSFSDAVTGAKRLNMLGLDGYYTQIMFENMPTIRGLANSYGLMYVPGPFMRAIAINKGSGSVTNGYESITGQINYEYKKPYDSERFFLNIFGTRHGMFELNTNFTHRFNDKLSTATYVHGSLQKFNHDENHDTFLDMPINERINVMHRWYYESDGGFELQAGINYVYDERESGQIVSKKHGHNLPEGVPLYRADIINRKYDAFAKTGYVFSKNTGQSIGVQYRYTHHSTSGWYGFNRYNGLEDYANVNLIFQTPMNKEHQSMKVGASYLYNNFREDFADIELSRKELVPGVFSEYTYQDNERLAIVAGMRLDMHNMFGAWLSPRVNFKYNFQPDFVIKINGGRGFRTANIFAENIQAFVSSREFLVEENLGYESAWNFGGGLFKELSIFNKPASISTDYFRTDFTHQIIADYETVGEVSFYNLDGKSYANSFQTEFNIELFRGFDFGVAYKFDDVNMTFRSGLKRAPYVPRHRVLLTLDYETKNRNWRFNANGHVNGKARIPSTASNPNPYRRPDESKTFFILNTQITRVINDWEVYLGGENITNFWQENPIIAADDPFGRYFDGGMVWGPLAGPRIFFGVRYSLPYKKNCD
jgi:outer membrane receptor for ferrienterochelin and colicins